MAVLVGIQKPDGVWESFVLTRFPRPTFLVGYEDVLGNRIPPFCYVEVYEGLERDDSARLANQLRGVPRAKRREVFLDLASGLRLRARGGTLKKP